MLRFTKVMSLSEELSFLSLLTVTEIDSLDFAGRAALEIPSWIVAILL